MSVGLASPPLFDLLESKLGWIESRQRVLSQNIANADTPGYRTRDVAPFSAHLQAFAVFYKPSQRYAVAVVQGCGVTELN